MIIKNIDATDEQIRDQMRTQREDLLYERRKRGYYEVDDFVLIRATNHIEEERCIKPLFHVPFIIKNNNVVLSAVRDILDEEDHIDFYREMDRYNERNEMIKKTYLPYSSQYRSTVHFTINGLVASHTKGDFSNRKFIIIDSLNHHLKNNDIRSFRTEDTFMYGDVSLSNTATIMIREEQYEEVILEYPWLNQYNIVLYSGSDKDAVEIYLSSIGIISEKIGEHGSEEHECSNQIRRFRDSLKETYGIDSEPHWLSSEYKKDDENSLLIWDYYNNLFYTFLLSKLNINEPEYSIRLSVLMDIRKADENEAYIKEIIKKIGLEQFRLLVEEFNFNIVNSIVKGTLKTNDEIVKELESSQKV